MAANPRSVFFIGVLAVVVAAVASYTLYNYLKGQEDKMKTATATEQVVVAAADIPIGTPIRADQVKTANWPKAERPQGQIFSTTEEVVGRIPVDRFVTGEPISAAKLVPKEGAAGVLTYKIPEGHRAMTVAVDQVAGVAGFINPGNKVDVVLTTSPTPGAVLQVSKIVLQNVPVLAIGQIVSEPKEGKPQVVPTVTVDVTPEDAEKLAIASTQGRLQLVLRRAGDITEAKTTGSTVTKVMTGAVPVKTQVVTKTRTKVVTKTVPAPKPPQADVFNVEVYRGDKRSVESFKGAAQ